MLIVLAIACILVMLIAMAVVAGTVNEFARKMEEFRQVLEDRYSLQAVIGAKKKVEETFKAATAPQTPFDNLLKKPDGSPRKAPTPP